MHGANTAPNAGGAYKKSRKDKDTGEQNLIAGWGTDEREGTNILRVT
jgi:hypothetical protein